MSAHTPGPWTLTPGGSIKGPQIALVFCSESIDVDERVANSRLIAAAPDGLAAVEKALAWLRDPDDTTLNQFERVASEFYKATGFTRPGKDVPVAAAEDDTERNRAWVEWCEDRSREVRAALVDFVSKARGGE